MPSGNLVTTKTKETTKMGLLKQSDEVLGEIAPDVLSKEEIQDIDGQTGLTDPLVDPLVDTTEDASDSPETTTALLEDDMDIKETADSENNDTLTERERDQAKSIGAGVRRVLKKRQDDEVDGTETLPED